MLVNDLMRGRVLYVAELFPPRPPDCSVKKRTFPTRSYSAQTKWAGGASMKSMVQKTLLGFSLRGIAGSERTRSRCSDSPRSAAHSGREASPLAEPQPRVARPRGTLPE